MERRLIASLPLSTRSSHGYDGMLIVDKPVGLTSHDVVAATRKIARQRSVGHAGTLDPLAGGVLVVLLGRATALAQWATDAAKTYVADIAFGVATETDDAEGAIVRRAPVPDLGVEELGRRLMSFVGEIAQRPPRYAAIKRGGQPLHRSARRGDVVAVEPRRVTVHSICVTSWQPPRLRLQLEVSKGTYIRSLARDIGEALDSAAYLHSLVRVRSGRFTLRDAVPLDRLREDGVAPHVLPLDTAVLDLPAIIVGDAEAQRVRHGGAVRVQGSTFNVQGSTGALSPQPVASVHDTSLPSTARGSVAGAVRVYGADGRLLALARQVGEQWRPFRVLEPAP